MTDTQSPYAPPQGISEAVDTPESFPAALRRDMEGTEGFVKGLGALYLVFGGLLALALGYAVFTQHWTRAFQTMRQLSGWGTVGYVVCLCVAGGGTMLLRRWARWLLLILIPFPLLPLCAVEITIPPAFLAPFLVNQVRVAYLWFLALSACSAFVMLLANVSVVMTASYRDIIRKTPSVQPPSVGSYATRLLVMNMIVMWLLSGLVGVPLRL